MDIARLTTLTGADPHEVEAVVAQFELRAPDDRSELLRELARVLGLGEARESATVDAGVVPATAPRTDVADEAAADLGLD